MALAASVRPPSPLAIDVHHQPTRLDLKAIDPHLGRHFGNYRIVSIIGAGGMGKVYLARHKFLNRTVAIKLLHEEYARDPEALEQFIQEAQAASAVEHPNIVSVVDFGQAPGVDEGGVYLVLEFVEDAESVADLVSREGRLSAFRAISIVNQIARALEAVHARSIVHGDIKPENVLVTPRPGRRMVERLTDDGSVVLEPEGNFDFVKLCDFGTAFLMKAGAATGSENVMGTPFYIAPEVARGNPHDHRADLYSLGVLFFELLTGQLPFEGESAEEEMRAHVFNQPPDPRQLVPGCDCNDAAAALVARALKKNPAQRYQSAHELRLDLQACYTTVRYPEAPADVVNARLAPCAPAPNSRSRPRIPRTTSRKLGGLLVRLFRNR